MLKILQRRQTKKEEYIVFFFLSFLDDSFVFFLKFFFLMCFFLYSMKCQATRIKIDAKSMFESRSSDTKMMQTPLHFTSRSTNCCGLLQ